MNLTELAAAQPEQLHAAATSFGAAQRTVARAFDRMELEVRGPLTDGSWRGGANRAAVAYVDWVLRELSLAQEQLGAADRALFQFAEAVPPVQRQAAEAERLAQAHQLVLGEDGRVEIPPLPAPTTPPEQEARDRAAELVHRELNQALTTATRADLICARTLAELPAGAGADGAGAGGAAGAAAGAALGDEDGDGGGLLSTAWNVASWLSAGLTVAEASGYLDLEDVPLVGQIGGAISAVGAVQGIADLIDQGNPVDAYEERGSDYLADVFQTEFNVASTAFAVAPDPISKLVTGAWVLGSGARWATAAHWNHIPFHDNIEDAVSWGRETAGDLWDSGTGAAGEALDAGGDLLSSGADLLGIG